VPVPVFVSVSVSVSPSGVLVCVEEMDVAGFVCLFV
jgi:hypothetical protein